MVIPGNHDSRNVGNTLRAALRGAVFDSGLRRGRHGRRGLIRARPRRRAVGREHYQFIHETFAMAEDKLKIFVIHHHLIPIPGTGRSATSSTMLGMCSSYSPIQRSTSSSRAQARARLEAREHVHRQRGDGLDDPPQGNTRPCYNVIEIEDGGEGLPQVPFKDRELIVDFDAATHQYLHFDEARAMAEEDLRKRRTMS